MVRFEIRISIFFAFVLTLTLIVYFGSRPAKPRKSTFEVITKARFQHGNRKVIPGNVGKEAKEAAAQAALGGGGGLSDLAALLGQRKADSDKVGKEKGKVEADKERAKNEAFVVKAQEEDEAEDDIASGKKGDPFGDKKKKKSPTYLSHPLVARLMSELGDNASKSTTRPPTIEDDEARFPITLCALIPDEQRFLPEWLLYHRLMGVERFILYDTVAPGSAGAGEIEELQEQSRKDSFVKGVMKEQGSPSGKVEEVVGDKKIEIPAAGGKKINDKNFPIEVKVDKSKPLAEEQPIVIVGKKEALLEEELNEDDEFEEIIPIPKKPTVNDEYLENAKAKMLAAMVGKGDRYKAAKARVQGSRQRRAPIVIIPFTGLGDDGKILPNRIAGIERWILDGTVIVKFLKQKDPKKIQPFNRLMTSHCTKAFSSTSDYLLHLDVDEFLIASTSLYGPQSPYQDAPPLLKDFLNPPPPSKIWHYPLHDLLQRPILKEAACIAVPQLKYRNVGIRYLLPIRGVLATHVIRDVVEHERLSEKTIIHTAYGSGFVSFDGPHSCKVQMGGSTPGGVTRAIKNSQGTLLQTGGIYKSSTDLPIEPLAIAHYGQRDLQQCLIRLAKSPDSKIICQEAYLPSQSELNSQEFREAPANQILLRVPLDGSVIYDERVKNSWSAEATRAVLAVWNQQPGATAEQIEAARDKVSILLK